MMKRIAILLCALVLILTATVAAAGEARAYVRGDADGNGKVTVLDATVIQRKLADVPVPAFDALAADVDGSGLDVTDATQIQRYLARLRTPSVVGETVMIPSETTVSPTDPNELPVVWR